GGGVHVVPPHPPRPGAAGVLGIAAGGGEADRNRHRPRGASRAPRVCRCQQRLLCLARPPPGDPGGDPVPPAGGPAVLQRRPGTVYGCGQNVWQPVRSNDIYRGSLARVRTDHPWPGGGDRRGGGGQGVGLDRQGGGDRPAMAGESPEIVDRGPMAQTTGPVLRCVVRVLPRGWASPRRWAHVSAAYPGCCGGGVKLTALGPDTIS